MDVLTRLQTEPRIRVYFLLLSLLTIFMAGFLGAIAGTSAQIQSIQSTQLFGRIAIQLTPFVLAGAAMIFATIVLTVLFGLVIYVSQYDKNAL